VEPNAKRACIEPTQREEDEDDDEGDQPYRELLCLLHAVKKVYAEEPQATQKVFGDVAELSVVDLAQHLEANPPDLETTTSPLEAIEQELDSIVGMAEVKTQLRTLRRTLEVDARRRAVGAPRRLQDPRHMIFRGAPGTGKTSVARLVGRLLHTLGVTKSTNFVEVQRSDLVAEHVGQTGPKTRKMIEQARGGVLFVDEAYRLVKSADGKDFGPEAIEEIMQDMTTGDPLVIMAGYRDDMRKFLDANAGLARRFPITIDFPNYTTEELAAIFELKLHTAGFRLAPGVTSREVAEALSKHTTEEYRGMRNGGVAEALLREALDAQEARLDPANFDKAESEEIRLSDVEEAAKALR